MNSGRDSDACLSGWSRYIQATPRSNLLAPRLWKEAPFPSAPVARCIGSTHAHVEQLFPLPASTAVRRCAHVCCYTERCSRLQQRDCVRRNCGNLISNVVLSIIVKRFGKVFPYSLPSVGPGADPGVQAVSPQVTWSESRHRPGSRLPLLSARPAVTSVAFTRWRYL